MLQQTRVATVLPYYERFLKRFPDFESLADAPESDLLAHWAGLGYYYRARNLQKAAQLMRDRGQFPVSFEEIRNLPGVGDYTAAAVASIGLGLPHATVDGNVLRVLSRVFDDATDISSSTGRRHFSNLADNLLDREDPGAFNQAMMELGATICLPKRPQCLVCPVSERCRARRNGRENELPIKLKRENSVEQERRVFWIERKGEVLVWQRPATSRLMPGFWELPEGGQLAGISEERRLGSFRHTITFHKYRFEVIEAVAHGSADGLQWIRLGELDCIPTSTILRKAKRVAETAKLEAEKRGEPDAQGPCTSVRVGRASIGSKRAT